MNWLWIGAWVLVALNILSPFVSLAFIGKPRQSYTPLSAGISIVISALTLIWLYNIMGNLPS